MQSFKVDENTLQKNYFTALANCLWADILIASVVDDPQAQQARTILRLFLEPATQPEQTAQQNAIRLAMDAHAVMMIAGHSGMPPEFICHVMGLQDPIR